MSENVTRKRSWRVDSTKAATEPDSPPRVSHPEMADAASLLTGDASTPFYRTLIRTIREFRLWGRRDRALGRTGDATRGSAEPSVETIVYDFAETLTSAIDPPVVASRLVQAAKTLTGARQVELVFDSDADSSTESCAVQWPGAEFPPTDESGLSLSVRIASGAQRWGTLRLLGMTAKRGERQPVCPSIRALKTLCTLAAMAFDGITTAQLFDTLGSEDAEDLVISTEATSIDPTAPLLRDATYLHVVLPYALSQARRHRESLSILHARIDRIAAIHEMLGPDLVTKAVNRVGEIVVARLRSSDIVSRMEDDRILAMLPNATTSDASRIANQIRVSVEETCASLDELPPLTVSIGVASYPSHCKDVDSLLIATDEALASAQTAGRNRVVVAAAPHSR